MFQGVDQGFHRVRAPVPGHEVDDDLGVMVDWKMEPPSSRLWRISRALVKVPLWPMARLWPLCCTTKGWALTRMVEPVVE